MDTTSHSDAGLPFHRAAVRVSKRLGLCRWFAAMRATVLPVMILGLAAFVLLRLLGFRWPEAPVALGLVALWAGGCALWALLRRPAPFAALARWDEAADRKEKFASAYFFEGKNFLEHSEKLHLEKSRGELDPALKGLPGDLPLPGIGWRLVLPLLVVGFALSPLFRPAVEAGDRLLSEEMKEKAAEEAAKIEGKENEFKKMAALSAEEKEEIEKLHQDIDRTADDLKKSGDKTTRDVLSELEERAKAAEKLAARMGSRGDEWASEEMIREMGQHPDTADLADALKDRDAGRSGGEAENISGKLKTPELSNEAAERMDTALSRIMKKATVEDHKRPVGQNVGNAAENMSEQKPTAASQDFDRLARHFKRLAEREKAQEKLRKLAEELRKAGSNIASKNLESMKKLAGNKGKGSQGKGMSPMQRNPNLTPLNRQNLPNLGQGQPMQLPGMKPGKPGSGKPMTFAPVPGGAKGKPMAIVPGQGQGKKPPKFVVPIPGTGQPMGMMPGGGGLQAGAGSAPMDKNPTEAVEAARSGLVTAQTGNQGDSNVRAVEGGERTETASRNREEQAVEFINVEEDALDEKALPLSRKEHVLRYFTALRERFEE